jgi:hypothetical protein
MNLQNYGKEMFPINFLFLTTIGIGSSARIGNLRVLVVTKKIIFVGQLLYRMYLPICLCHAASGCVTHKHVARILLHAGRGMLQL